MAPIPPPGPSPQLCPRCALPLPEPRPPYCPRCGAALQQRPVWLTVIAALGAAFLGFAALCLGAFGACVAILVAGEGGSTASSDALWIWGVLIGAVLCAAAAIALLVWLFKKPKPKP
ncbi:hypothetical protein IAD21_04294 [Abditibacteriota bacterium]|nr:hypothetical protein IAD21_04294 [Abditibacteriota bacterium]